MGVWGWDCFFGSLLTNVEDTAQTSAAVRAILLAHYADGVAPNVTSRDGRNPDRSQPPIGSYALWKNYQKNQDETLLRRTYPRLKLWRGWWFGNRGDGQPERDGNRDALDSKCMEKVTGILGNQDDERVFAADYARMKAAMQKLWNDDDSMFENRYWDGRFSKRLSPTNFYPLIAGVATPNRQNKW
jgi:putative isomerase